VKARPILMGARSVQNMLAGRKTQTRRIVKPPAPADAKDAGVIGSDSASNGLWFWLDSEDILDASTVGDEFRCPYGVPGDLLWVREKFCRAADLENDLARRWWGCDKHRHCAYAADDDVAAMEEFHPPWTSSMRMPRSLSRLTLRLTDVRVERLNGISDHDCVAEGVHVADFRLPGDTALVAYRRIWEEIHGQFSWGDNPWVWKVAFEVLRCNVDAVARRTPNEVAV
jgi:hypothetical protein